jgi:hypothetical protein
MKKVKIKTIKLDGFYPDSLEIRKVTELENQIVIQLKSQKHSHMCRKCGKEMAAYHGTYIRKVICILTGMRGITACRRTSP